MSKQKLHPLKRQAILAAHNDTCAYCFTPIRIGQMQIDHIVPESLLKLPENERNLELRKLGLSEDFNILGLENLVPSCLRCNKQKRDRKLGLTSIMVGVAKSKIQKIQSSLKKSKLLKEQDDLFIRLMSLIALNEISPYEVSQRLIFGSELKTRFKINKDYSPELSGDFLADRIDDYMDTKIEDEHPLEMIKDGQYRYIRTLREFKDAINNDFQATCNADMKRAANLFDNPLSIYQALENAQIPKNSSIDYLRRGLPDIELLPSALFSVSKASTSAKTLKELMESQKSPARIESVGSNYIEVFYEDWSTFMVEIARADFKGNGQEEILVIHRTQLSNGTLLLTCIYILSYSPQGECFEYEPYRWTTKCLW